MLMCFFLQSDDLSPIPDPQSTGGMHAPSIQAGNGDEDGVVAMMCNGVFDLLDEADGCVQSCQSMYRTCLAALAPSAQRHHSRAATTTVPPPAAAAATFFLDRSALAKCDLF